MTRGAGVVGFGQARDRAARLVALACVLQLGRPLTLAELRERFDLYTEGGPDASRRQFERDKADLRALGVEVATLSTAAGEAYRIPTAPPTIAVDWSAQEAVALAALAAAVDDETSGGALAKATSHTGDYPAEHTPARVDLDPPVPDALARAVARRRTVRFRYRNARGEVADRTVEPWSVAMRRGQAYVTGHDRDHGEGRAFRVDRVLDEPTDVGPATAPRPAAGPGVPLAPPAASTVHLVVPLARVPDAVAMGARVVAESDLDAEVVLDGVRDETAVGWSLRHRADVLAPDHVVAAVAHRRDRLREVHTGPPSLAPFDPTAPARRPRRAGLSATRLTRLLALPEWLAARPGVTVEEVASAFGCTRAEVEAELDLLEWLEVPRLGFVGDLVRHADGQLEFQPHLSAPRAELTVVEAVHLLTLVVIARALLPSTTRTVLARIADRLRSVLPAGAEQVWLAELEDPDLATLRDAVDRGAMVAFTYRGRRDAQAHRRRVHPELLHLADGALYLNAHDLERDAPRTFRLDRISEVAVLDEPNHTDAADRAAARDVAPRYVPVDDEVRVELRLSPRGVWILTLMVPTARTELHDGSCHAVVHTDAPAWLLAHVRAAGGEAEVLRPDHLRRVVAEAP